MDAKELRNPVHVYREVESIIDNSPYRYLYQDYIHKLRQHPSYSKGISTEEGLKKVRLKKVTLKAVNALKTDISKLGEAMRLVVVTPDDPYTLKKDAISRVYTALFGIKTDVSGLVSKISREGIEPSDYMKRAKDTTNELFNTFVRAWSNWLSAGPPPVELSDKRLIPLCELMATTGKHVLEEFDKLVAE